MEKTIRIQCPSCGAILKVEDSPSLAHKSIICPACKAKTPFTSFTIVPEKEKTSDVTTFVTATNAGIGYFQDIETRQRYQLQEGRNVLGRMTYKGPPKASLPIETNDMSMSREHLCVDVIKGTDGYYHTYVSNAKNINATSINGVLLPNGDCPALKNGDILQLGKTQLRYFAPIVEVSTVLS